MNCRACRELSQIFSLFPKFGFSSGVLAQEMYPRGGFGSEAKYGVTTETNTPIARGPCPENFLNENGMTPVMWLFDGCNSAIFIAVKTEMSEVSVVLFSLHFLTSLLTAAGPSEKVLRLGVTVGSDEATGGPDQFCGSTRL